MTRKEWAVLGIGICILCANLLFPRNNGGTHYYFIATAKYYAVSEMVVRQLTLLVILTGTLFLFRSGERKLNYKQKIILLLGMALWILVFLFPPNIYGDLEGHYFAPDWVANYVNYASVAIQWFIIALYCVPLMLINADSANGSHSLMIFAAIGMLPLSLFVNMVFFVHEDMTLFNPVLSTLAALIGFFILLSVLVQQRKALRKTLQRKDAI